MSNTTILRGNGKLLISGEYLVLDGAIALAIPCRFGQSFHFLASEQATDLLKWRAYDMYGNCWMSGVYNKKKQVWESGEEAQILARLSELFSFLGGEKWQQIEEVNSFLDYPAEWGLGSSSTLVWALGKYFDADPYEINRQVFRGSGYDIACAEAECAIFYTFRNGLPHVQAIDWNPPFEEQMAFVYLGQKQSSYKAIHSYKKKDPADAALVKKVSEIGVGIVRSKTHHELTDYLLQHEMILSKHLGEPMIQTVRFDDFSGQVKSLGAWGGDFALAVFESEPDYSYFYEKGYPTVIPFERMRLSAKHSGLAV